MNQKLLFFIVMSMVSSPVLNAEEIAVGAAAPRIQAIDQDGKTIDLGALYDKGPVLIYFYPKADTPGCTAQACNIRDHWTELQSHGITVVGVSIDSAADQLAFQKKYQLPFPLLADTDKKVVNAFGVPHTMGFAKRQAYLIKGGKVVWRDLSAKPKSQSQDVLSALAADR